MVVDDEAPITEYLKMMFEREGYAVDAADGGWPAFQMIQDKPYAFVLSDVRMVKGDGIELLENVQGLDQRPPLALLSAFTDVMTADIFERGAVAFIQKPIDWPALMGTVRRVTRPPAVRWTGASEPQQVLEASWPTWKEATAKGQLALGAGGCFLALKAGQPSVDSLVRFDFRFTEGAPGRLQGTAAVRWARGASRHGFHPGVGLEFLTVDDACLPFVLAELARTEPKAFIPIGFGRATANER